MARNENKEYWGADLPKHSDALAELDQFCNDQGMISRSDATRMILIAWAKARKGQDAAVWSGVQPVAPAQPIPAQPSQGQTQEYRPRRVLNGNAASAELDL